ncbi:chorismate mutase [bacterium]|nr:chorismate mutase [bacterium]
MERIEIDILRKRLDQLDDEIVTLLLKRAHIAKQVIAEKKRQNFDVEDSQREKAILQTLCASAPEEYHSLIESIYVELFSWVKR